VRARNAGDVIVSQFNFGTGSSREQAVTCLKAKGIPAGESRPAFSQTYLRNAFNNGFLCIEVPEFVARVRASLRPRSPPKENNGDSRRRPLISIHFGVQSTGAERNLRSRPWRVPQSLRDWPAGWEPGATRLSVDINQLPMKTCHPEPKRRPAVFSGVSALDILKEHYGEYTVITMRGDAHRQPGSARITTVSQKPVGF